ncbi:hypothetical protein ACFV9E_02270 [Streptomyces sp. NPDC059835]|uniref:hypothetical protein n=1 Tax=Streptomyces sp. NPDC059835 TaxID=3346967 RepID=UPI00365475EB
MHHDDTYDTFDDKREGGPVDGNGDFEVNLRDRLTLDAATVRPSSAPLPEILRQGRAEQRRRRMTVAGAALAVLALVPATAIALGSGEPSSRVSAAGGTTPPTTAPQTPPPPTGPAAPATPGQLADGIDLQAAAAGLEQCLAMDAEHAAMAGAPARQDLGKAADYRILLAQRSTGNDNSPGAGRFIVAVKDTPLPIRLICNVKSDKASNLNTSVGKDDAPGDRAVVPDMNGGKLYLQRLSTEGPWKLPYRWGSIGTVDSRVSRVTVTYGDVTAEAALDHGWFAATGTLEQRVTQAPRIKGYDAEGKQIYDSDTDKFYDKPIP